MNYKLKEGKYIEYSKGSVPILSNIKPKSNLLWRTNNYTQFKGRIYIIE
jgi:hypothetical protein